MQWKRIFNKTLKIIGILFLVLIIAVFILYRIIFSPLTDQEVSEKFKNQATQPFLKHIKFKNRSVRVIEMQEEIDTVLPTLIFVHGSPGSSMDFKRYLSDKDLNDKANIMTYDRIGYGENYRGDILNSLEEEVELLHLVLGEQNLDKVILIGYSYGATTILASSENVLKKMVIAGAFKGELEPMFWAMKLYQWKLTRPLIPSIFRAASQEKFRHLIELDQYKNKWNLSKSPVISIHGDKDRIVSYKNSLFLQSIFSHDQFDLVTLENGTHSLIWSDFDRIKEEILNMLAN